ncbi:hypothetical protein CYY_006686 [Polysphondylium violaceum]|uniref:Uncharacterized protein n=1 Tax=Polysphondylium violaceum TaxID=133409 RepID=A0A8J4PQ70_9MYCE|nr:hypothetical protein CYY_006686 [Polysphondylium violaceum]
MTISGIVIQQHDGTILFSNVREYLSPDKALLAAKAFKNHISLNDDHFITKGSTNHLTGSIVVLNMYRVHYMILNDIFILAISQANDNPYEGSVYLVRVKRVLWTVSKELLIHNIMKKYTEVYFALERVLFGEDGVDVLTQRINEIQPHFTQSTQPTTQNLIAPPSFITGSQNTPQPVNIFGRIIETTNSNNVIPPSLTYSNSSSSTPISTTPTSTSPTSNIINNSFSSPSNNSNSSNNLSSSQVSISSTTSSLSSNNLLNSSSSNGFIIDNNLDYQQHQLNIISSLENIEIPAKVFTQPDTLPKIDKHIYDPPQTVKWGNTSVQSTATTSTRVTNRIMFTLRHPNAAQNSKDENEGSSNGSGGGGSVAMNHSSGGAGNSASKDTTPISSPLASSFNSLIDVSSPDFNSSDDGKQQSSPENVAQSSSPPSNGDELPPTEPKRKFSLSMGTFKNNSTNGAQVANVCSKPDLETSSAPQPTPPPSVPIPANVKSKMNFLNF